MLWTNGKARLVTSKHTLGVAVDERGRVIGTLWLNDTKDHLFMWEKNRVRLIGVGGFKAMNERGQVVGATQLDTPRPLLWEGGTRTLLPLRSGDKYGSALGLNARNQIVGWSGNSFLGDKDEVYKGRLVLWTLKR